VTVAHLTQAWLDRYVELAADLPPRPGASARLQHVVTKTPDGDVSYVIAFEDGRIVSATLGTDAAADMTVNAPHPDAQAMARGELDLHAGFMQGRLKLVGSMQAFMAVLPTTQSAEHRAVLDALAAETKV
jgi:putative sterol carrier protein